MTESVVYAVPHCGQITLSPMTHSFSANAYHPQDRYRGIIRKYDPLMGGSFLNFSVRTWNFPPQPPHLTGIPAILTPST